MDDSTDNTRELLSKYPQELLETVEGIGKSDVRQIMMLNDCLHSLRDISEYILFLDVDEFIWFKYPHQDLYTLVDDSMASYTQSIRFASMTFGTSHIRNKTKGLVIENYLRRSFREEVDLTMWVPNKKFLVRSELVNMVTIHNPILQKTFRDDPHPLIGGKSRADFPDINLMTNRFMNELDPLTVRLNHYFTRSEEEVYMRRKQKTVANTNGRCTHLSLEECVLFYERMNEVYDDSMLSIVPKVKEEMSRIG